MNEKEIINQLYEKNRNLIIDGNIGTGKSTCVFYQLINKIIKNNNNVIIIDKKKEYINKYYNLLKTNDYDISIINLANPSKSNVWNPLFYPYKYYKENNIDNCINELVEIIRTFLENNSETDSFWKKSVIDLFVGLTLILFKEADENEINIASLYKMISFMSIDNGYTIGNYLENKYDYTIDCYLRSILVAPQNTKKTIITESLQTFSEMIISPNIKSLVCSNNTKELKNKHAIFIIPNQINNNINYIMQIYLNQYYNKSINNANKNNTSIIIDDIDDCKKIEKLPIYLNNCMTNNIRFIIGTKSIVSLETKYSELISHLADYIKITKEDIEYNIENKKGKISREWKVDEFEFSEPKYPNLDKSEIFEFNLQNFIKNEKIIDFEEIEKKLSELEKK